MHNFYLILDWSVSIALLSLGLVTLLNNYRLTLNRVFAFFALSVSIWFVAAYISNDTVNSPKTSHIGNYFVFLFSYIASYLLLWFAIMLAQDRRYVTWLRRLIAPVVLIGITTCTPLVVAGVERQGAVYAVEFGPLVGLYFIAILAPLVLSLIVLGKNVKRKKGGQRSQLVIFYRSMLVAIPILLLTQFILPAVTGWFGLTNIGLLVMAIPVFALYYGVIRLRLFDIRLIVLRALVYIFTVLTLTLVYSLLSFEVSRYIPVYDNVVYHNLIQAGLIGLVVVGYPPLIRVFNRLTNKLFFRDIYQPQQFLNTLNDILVQKVEVEALLGSVVEIIEDNMKVLSPLFYICETAYFPARLVGRNNFDISSNEIEQLANAGTSSHQKVLIADMLSERSSTLYRLMKKRNMAVFIRLVPSMQYGGVPLGFIMLGDKKNGLPYSLEDKRVLEIITNELIIALENSFRFEEIQKFNITLQDKVDAATNQLRHSNDKLKAIDETKDEFISMASHQLRTPLTSVKGYLSMVLEGDVGELNDMQRKMLNQAFVSSQRMVYLIADLLNLSRLRTGKFVIDAIPTNLDEVIKSEIDQLRETAASHSLELVYHSPNAFPVYMLDETKIRQVLMNFIDNAVYYTPSGGKIVVALRETAQTIEFTVTDNGIGVPRAEQPHLFTKFYRASNARGARPDGTGLGLFMAKKVIVAQGGAVIFKSTEGHGSTFGFSFAKAKLQTPPPKQKEQTANG